MLPYFNNIFLFNSYICINKMKELVYYEENQKNIYFLQENNSIFDKIKFLYNNPVKRI